MFRKRYPYRRYRRRFTRFPRRRNLGRIKLFHKAVQKVIKNKIEEKKNITDIVNSTTVYGSTTNFFTENITYIKGGSDKNQRVGNVVHLKSLWMNIHIKRNPTTLADMVPFNLRVLVIMDKRPATPGTAPLLSRILTNTADSSQAVCSTYNIETQAGTYKILYDKHHNFKWSSKFNTGILDNALYIEDAMIKKYIDLKNTKCVFSGSTEGTCIENALWLMVLGNNGSANPVSLYGTYRLMFVE